MDPVSSGNFSPTANLESWTKALCKTEEFYDAKQIIGLVHEVKRALEIYVTFVLQNDLETQIREDLLVKIQQKLEQIISELENSKYSEDDSERLFDALSACHESIKTLLLDHTSEKGWYSSVLGLFQETTAPQEIKWKIKKYENLILAIFKGMESLNSQPAIVLAQSIQLPDIYQTMIQENNIERFTLDYLSVLRAKYCTNFMQKLRRLLQKFPTDEGLLEICYHLFCNISLDEDNQNVLQLFDKWGDKCLKDQTFASRFTQPTVVEIDFIQQKVYAVPNSAKAPYISKWGNSLRGVLNRDFDPDIQGNPIHCLYTIKIAGKEIKSLGFGTPTIEGLTFLNSATLTPEFLGFLRACKNKGKRHLFITNQDITSNGYIGAEKQRCDLVMDLQNDEVFKGTFFAIALSKDSSFYYQNERDYLSANDFIDFLVGQFQDPSSGCVISNEIIKTTQLNLKHIAESIQRHIFNGADNLKRSERLVFIELFYDAVTKWLIQKLEIDSFNISCKDAIDRGAASNAQLYSHLAIINRIFTDEHKQRTTVLMMVRALLVRKRGPVKKRVDRFLESLEFYLTHQNQLIELHQKLFGEHVFLPCRFI